MNSLTHDTAPAPSGQNAITNLPSAVPLTKAGFTGLIAKGISVSSREKGAMDRLILCAMNRLEDTLRGYGNELSEQHRQALKEVITTYAEITHGENKGRLAYPLGPGLGKTQSIVAFIATAFERSYFAQDVADCFSVAIAANKIEALCELKRDLVTAGVPEALIGLKHSYEFNRLKASRYLNGAAELPPGHASEPSTEGNECRPILLCSHNLIKGKTGLDMFYNFDGQPRSLLIWDETLLKSSGTGIPRLRLMQGYGYRYPELENDEDVGAAALKYVLDFINKLDDELEWLRNGGEPREIRLGILDRYTIKSFKKMMTQSPITESIRALLDLSQESLRVADVYGQDMGGYVHYDLVVPPELDRVVVLDASHPIRKLAEADSTITNMSPDASNLVSYENVTVKQLQYHSGRYTMHKVASGRDPKARMLLKEIVGAIKTIPKSEGIVLFTFKRRLDMRYRKEIDFKEKLIDALERADIDTTEKILVLDHKTKQMVERDRFVWLTHGNETSTSRYSYCSNVFFCGVLHRSRVDLAASLVGQSDDLLKHLEKEELDEAHLGEVAYSIHQGICRSACRIVDGINEDGKSSTRPATVWLIHKDGPTPVKDVLWKVMPGIVWETWRPKFIVLEAKIKGLAGKILEYLNNQKLVRISTMKVKREMHLQEVPPRTFTCAVSKITNNSNNGWALEGRSFVRKQRASDFGFSTSATV